MFSIKNWHFAYLKYLSQYPNLNRSLIKNNTKDLVKKSSFFFKSLTYWLGESLVLLSHGNTFASKSFSGHWRCLPCFIRLEILINFVGNKKNFFYQRSCLESQFFSKISDPLTWWFFTVLLSHNNLFVSEAFVVIGDVCPALFAMRCLWTLLEEKNFFLMKLFYFFICLSSNKLYWIEDQLTDVSTQLYMLASWRWQVEPSAIWLDTTHTA